MDEGPPRRPVAQEVESAGHVAPRREVVEDDVEPEPGRRPVDGRVPHRDGREPVPVEVEERLLRPHLRLGVGGQRPQRRLLARATRRPSEAPYMEHEDAKTKRPTPATLLHARARRVARWLMSIRQLGAEIAERIVRERGEMDDRVEAARGPRDGTSRTSRSRADGPAAVASRSRSRRRSPCRARRRRVRRRRRAGESTEPMYPAVPGDEDLHVDPASTRVARPSPCGRRTPPRIRSARGTPSPAGASGRGTPRRRTSASRAGWRSARESSRSFFSTCDSSSGT